MDIWGLDNLAYFEVSSEGEFEQVRAIVDHFLKQNKYIEIIFCSSSVEKNVKKLYESSSANIRYFCLPVLTYLPGRKGHSLHNWLTAKRIVLCRYDFFPELMMICRKKSVQAFLVICR